MPGAVYRPAESGNIGNQVIGGQDQQLGVLAVTPGHVQGSRRDGRGSVAAKGLEDKVQLYTGGVQWAIVVERAEKHVPIGNGQQPIHVTQPDCATERLLQQALAIWQAHKGLWHGLS